MSKRRTVIKPLSAAKTEKIAALFHNVARVNEAFVGWLGDQATIGIYPAYERYRDVCSKYGDDSWMAFPAFIEHVAGISYVKYDNDTGDVHFLLKKAA